MLNQNVFFDQSDSRFASVTFSGAFDGTNRFMGILAKLILCHRLPDGESVDIKFLNLGSEGNRIMHIEDEQAVVSHILGDSIPDNTVTVVNANCLTWVVDKIRDAFDQSFDCVFPGFERQDDLIDDIGKRYYRIPRFYVDKARGRAVVLATYMTLPMYCRISMMIPRLLPKYFAGVDWKNDEGQKPDVKWLMFAMSASVSDTENCLDRFGQEVEAFVLGMEQGG